MPNAPVYPVSIKGRSYFHLRVDYRDEIDLEKIIRYVKQTTAYNILVVHEISKDVKKEHVHCLFDELLSLSQLRKKFQAMFEVPYDGTAKVKEYAFTNVERKPDSFGVVPSHQDAIEAMERYLCKGQGIDKVDVRASRGEYEDTEFISERNAQYWEINAELKKAHTMKPIDGPLGAFGFKAGTHVVIHEHTKAPRKSRSFIADVVCNLEAQVSQRDDWVWFAPGAIRNHAEVVLKTILKMHGQNFKPYGDTQIENEYNAVVQCLAEDYQTKTMIERLKHRGVIPL